MSVTAPVMLEVAMTDTREVPEPTSVANGSRSDAARGPAGRGDANSWPVRCA